MCCADDQVVGGTGRISAGYMINICRSRWPRGLRLRSATARLLRLRVRIPPGAWMSVSCECCVLSGRGLCDELITRPGESYRLCCVVVCDQETSWMRRSWPTGGCRAKKKKSTYSSRQKKKNVINIFLSTPTLQQFTDVVGGHRYSLAQNTSI